MNSTEVERIGMLVEQARSGSAEAMTELVRLIQPLVLRRCTKLLPFRADAEEAAQDALVSITGKLETFDPHRGTFLGWVTVIASNSARSTYRSLKRRSDEQTSERTPEHVDPRRTSVIAGSRIDVLEALESLEKSHPAIVEAFVLRDIGSLPYGEIAELTGTPLGTVKARIHQARAFMRGRLIDQLT